MKTRKSKKPFQRHASEVKSDVVELVRSGGKTITEAARDLGLAHSLVRACVSCRLKGLEGTCRAVAAGAVAK